MRPMRTQVSGTYTGKVAFVTGAAAASVVAAAVVFAREDASVVVADLSEQGNEVTLA